MTAPIGVNDVHSARYTMNAIPGPELRRVLGHFATGVTLVTCRDEGRARGMTANAFTSVSLDPPLVLISVGKLAATSRHISASGAFAVNILSSEQDEIARRFAGRHREMVDPFRDIPYWTGWSGSPILADVVAWVDCALYATYDGGDHTLFLGQIVDVGLDPTRAPILFYGGAFRQLGANGVDDLPAAGPSAARRKAG